MILYACVLLKEKIDIFFIYCLVSFIYVYVYITPLGRPRHGWEDNIRMNLKEIGINARNWVDSAQNRDWWRALVNTAFNVRVPGAMELVISVKLTPILSMCLQSVKS